MEDFEKLGAFYLGREYDLSRKQNGRLLLYDSKDLVTHGVCVGMTGSGKTGLCVGLLEHPPTIGNINAANTITARISIRVFIVVAL